MSKLNEINIAKMGKIKISIEAFGENALTRIFEASELEGKNIKEILETMVRERWEGKDLIASEAVTSEMRGIAGYAISHKVRRINEPIVYKLVSLKDPIKKYEINGNINLQLQAYTYIG